MLWNVAVVQTGGQDRRLLQGTALTSPDTGLSVCNPGVRVKELAFLPQATCGTSLRITNCVLFAV